MSFQWEMSAQAVTFQKQQQLLVTQCLDSESIHVPQLCLSSGAVLWAGALTLQWDTATAQQSGTPATNSLHAISVW